MRVISRSRLIGPPPLAARVQVEARDDLAHAWGDPEQERRV